MLTKARFFERRAGLRPGHSLESVPIGSKTPARPARISANPKTAFWRKISRRAQPTRGEGGASLFLGRVGCAVPGAVAVPSPAPVLALESEHIGGSIGARCHA